MFGGTAWARTTIRRLTAFRNDLYTTDPNKKSRNRCAGSNYYLRTVSGLHFADLSACDGWSSRRYVEVTN